MRRVRHGGATEVQRAADTCCFAGESDHGFDYVGIGALAFFHDLHSEGRDIYFRRVERIQHGGNHGGVDCRQIALDIDDGVIPAAGVEPLKRLMHPVRSAGQIGIRHHGIAPSRGNGIGDRLIPGSDQHGTYASLDRAAPHVNDHRCAVYVSQWFVGKSRGGETSRYDNDGVLG